MLNARISMEAQILFAWGSNLLKNFDMFECKLRTTLSQVHGKTYKYRSFNINCVKYELTRIWQEL